MPPLKHLDDGQIAAAITYVRREFGNQSGMVTPAKVAEIRAATAARQNPWTDPELVSLKK
jgi:mono/diheme cytochrome c family protein